MTFGQCCIAWDSPETFKRKSRIREFIINRNSSSHPFFGAKDIKRELEDRIENLTKYTGDEKKEKAESILITCHNIKCIFQSKISLDELKKDHSRYIKIPKDIRKKYKISDNERDRFNKYMDEKKSVLEEIVRTEEIRGLNDEELRQYEYQEVSCDIFRKEGEEMMRQIASTNALYHSLITKQIDTKKKQSYSKSNDKA